MNFIAFLMSFVETERDGSVVGTVVTVFENRAAMFTSSTSGRWSECVNVENGRKAICWMESARSRLRIAWSMRWEPV